MNIIIRVDLGRSLVLDERPNNSYFNIESNSYYFDTCSSDLKRKKLSNLVLSRIHTI